MIKTEERQYRLADEAGYYEWLRESTTKELAATVGVAPATFAHYPRVTGRKVIRLLFD